jgi:hypothetical protein
MESQPAAAMVYGATQYWHSWTGNPEDLGRDWAPKLGVPPNTLITPPVLLPLFWRGEAAVPSPCDIMVRREVVDGVGGFEESFRSLYEDQVFYAKVCLKAPVFVSDQCWARYRQHQESACSVARKIGLNHTAHRTFLNWVESYLSKQAVNNAEVWETLQNSLRPYRQPILRRLSVCGQHRIRQMQGLLRKIARGTLPASIHQWLRAQWRGQLR